MKKAIALILMLCLTLPCLTACDPSAIFGSNEVAKAPDILITVEELTPGKTIDEIEITVKFDGQPAAINKLEWEEFTVDDRRYMESGDKIPENFWGRLNVYYYLPLGVQNNGDLPVTIEAPGGVYDGTGEGGTADDGRIEAWSHVIYGNAPDAEESADTPDTSVDTGTAVDTSTAAHEHAWVEDQSIRPVVMCEYDTHVTYKCACGETKQEIIPAQGHKLTDGARTEPTCKYEGSITRRCTVCGAGFIYEIPATGHDWSAYSAYGTYHERTCSKCGESERGNHEFDPGSVTCKVCGRDIIN